MKCLCLRHGFSMPFLYAKNYLLIKRKNILTTVAATDIITIVAAVVIICD